MYNQVTKYALVMLSSYQKDFLHEGSLDLSYLFRDPCIFTNYSCRPRLGHDWATFVATTRLFNGVIFSRLILFENATKKMIILRLIHSSIEFIARNNRIHNFCRKIYSWDRIYPSTAKTVACAMHNSTTLNIFFFFFTKIDY